MTRRGFIQVLLAAGWVPAVGIYGWWPWRRARAVVDRRTLSALADTIVPRDQYPGAVDAGVPDRILEMFQSKGWLAELYRRGFTVLDRLARDTGADGFAALDSAGRARVLEALIRGRDRSRIDGRVLVQLSRKHVLAFYYASAPGQAMVAYVPPADGYPDYAAPPPEK